MISVVVPTYREVENLRPLVERISGALAPTGRGFEIVIVDDSSGDGTDRAVADLTARGYPVRLIVRRNERGLSSAVIHGFRQSAGEILVCMDADLSHPPEVLPRFLEVLDDPTVDFVLGSRYVPGAGIEETWGWLRRLNSKVATLLARPLAPVKDPMSGFFALRRETFEQAAPLNPVGCKIGLELLVKCRCRKIVEIPIRFACRKFGHSKLSLGEQIHYLEHLKRLADFKYGRPCLPGSRSVGPVPTRGGGKDAGGMLFTRPRGMD